MAAVVASASDSCLVPMDLHQVAAQLVAVVVVDHEASAVFASQALPPFVHWASAVLHQTEVYP